MTANEPHDSRPLVMPPVQSSLERLLWSPVSRGQLWLMVPASVTVAVLCAWLLQGMLPHANLSLIFVVTVLVVAGRTGLVPSMLTALVSFFAYNYLFTAPARTLQVQDPTELATLGFFLVTAILVALLGARMRRYVVVATQQAERAAGLNEYSKRLAVAADPPTVADELCATIEKLARVAARVDLSGDVAPDRADPNSTAIELIGAGHAFGLVTVATNDPAVLALVRALCAQSAVVLERIDLGAALDRARVEAETERLRTALLSSVSHDLRTPLASIIGATTSLRELGTTLGADARDELFDMVVHEAERLNRYIQNLLDMARLGQGGLTLERDWTDPDDIVASALLRLHDVLGEVVLVRDIVADPPLLLVHGAMIEQALVNVLENAARHSPPGGRLTLAMYTDGAHLVITVTDQGPGIPECDRERVFETFYSAKRGGAADGTGLGLAISRGFIGAHGGSIVAGSGPDGIGAAFRITLPLPTEAPPPDDD